MSPRVLLLLVALFFATFSSALVTELETSPFLDGSIDNGNHEVHVAYYDSLGVVFVGLPLLDKVAVAGPGAIGNSISNPGSSGDHFGASIAFSEGVLAVGAPGANGGAGLVYIYDCGNYTAVGCVPSATLNGFSLFADAEFGSTLDFAKSLLVVGAPGSNGGKGAAFVYLCFANCVSFANITEASLIAGDRFGASVSVSTPPIRVVVGAPGNAAAAHVFDCVFAPPESLNCTLMATLLNTQSQAGFASSVLNFGNQVLVGAPGDASHPGIVYQTTCDTTCSSVSELPNNAAVNNDGFGSAMDYSSGSLYVSASNRNGNATVTVYDCTSACVEEVTADLGPNNVVSGTSLVLRGGVAVLGAPGYLSGKGGVVFLWVGCGAEAEQEGNSGWAQTALGTNVTTTCDEGYFSTGSQRFCGYNGNFSQDIAPCTRVTCQQGEDAMGTWGAANSSESVNVQCKGGYFAQNTAINCSFNGAYTGVWDANPCAVVNCLEGVNMTASWPTTQAGTSANFTCQLGYFAENSVVACIQQGGSASWDSNPCARVYCPAGENDASKWNSTATETNVQIECKSGYYAAFPVYDCSFFYSAVGSWGTNPCHAVKCPAGSNDLASWEETLSGTSANFTCADGAYAANPVVDCIQSGDLATWGTNPCAQVVCESGESATATWGEAAVGDQAYYTCKDGYYAQASAVNCTRVQNAGVWDANPCAAVRCHAETFANAAWPQTLSVTTATGTCAEGFTGKPTRACLQQGPTAVWDTVEKPCQRPPAGSSAVVVSLVFYIKNIDYNWVIANRAAFDAAFIENLETLFGINPADVTINTITQGSAIVDFSVKTDNRDSFKSSVNDFFASSNPSLDFTSLPVASLENAESGTSLDPHQSVIKPDNTGAIVGGVIGGFVGLLLVVVIIVVIVRRKKDKGAGKSKSQEKMNHEMID